MSKRNPRVHSGSITRAIIALLAIGMSAQETKEPTWTLNHGALQRFYYCAQMDAYDDLKDILSDTINQKVAAIRKQLACDELHAIIEAATAGGPK